MNLNKDIESWNLVSAIAVCAGSKHQVQNVLTMALQDIQKLGRAIVSEQEARFKLDAALRQKDDAMGKLFERMKAAGVDYSDLIP